MNHRSELPAAVQQQLQALRSHLRRTAALRGFGLLLLTGTATLIALLTADFAVDFESSTRAALLTGLVALCVTTCVLTIVRPFLLQIPDDELAAIAERRYPELRERLTSLVELSDNRLPEQQRGSALMREMLQRETVVAVERSDLMDAVNAGRAVRCSIAGMIVAAACVLCWLLFPNPSRLLIARLVNPWGNYASAGPLTFEISPGDCVVARGTDVIITTDVAWTDSRAEPVPEPVTLLWSNSSGQSDQRQLRFDADTDAFVAVIPDAQESFQFRVAADGSRSKAVSVNVEDAPQIVTASLEVTPPAYVGRPRQSFDGVAGEMTAFEHSRLKFHVTFNKPVTLAELDWLGPLIIPEDERARAAANPDGDGADFTQPIREHRNELLPADALPPEVFTLSADGMAASLQIPAVVQGTLAFRLTDEHGLTNPEDPYRYLKIERDQPPQIEVAGGQHDTARPSDVYPLELAVSDDVDVELLELHVTSRDGVNEAGINTVLRLPENELGKRSLSHRFRVDLAQLDVKSGTLLRMQARATDGRPIPQPNETWSTVRYVTISDDADAPGTTDLLAQQQQLRTELQGIRKGLQQATEASDELAEQAAKAVEQDMPLPNAERLDELAQREARLTERLQQLAELLQERPLFDKVAETAEQTASNELAPATERLQQASNATAQEQAETLRRNGDETDMAAEQLLELEARFDRLAQLERDLLELDRIAERAGRLANDAGQLSELREQLDAARQTAENPTESAPETTPPGQNDAGENDTTPSSDAQRLAAAQNELAAAQQELNDEHQELADELKSLLDERPELLDAARDQQLQRLQQVAQQATQLAQREELLAEAFDEEAQTVDSANTAASNATEPDPAPTLEELIRREQELATEIAEVALAAADAQGEATPASLSGVESAMSAMQAKQQAEGGQFGQAAQHAHQAGEAARQTQQALDADQPALASRAEDVAAAQQELAQQFQALQDSAPQRAAARRNQQQQVADAAGQIAEELDELTESLSAEPLGLNEQGQNAGSARQSAQSATQAATQAAEHLESGSPAEAAQAASTSASALREAAASAAGQTATPADATSPSAGEPASAGTEHAPSQTALNDVPGELASQVVSAARQLMQAQQQLGEAIASVQPSDQNAPTGQPAAPANGALAQASPSASDVSSGQSPTSQTPASAGQPADSPANGETSPTGQQASASASSDQPAEGGQPSGSAGDPSTGGQAGQNPAPASDALQRAADALAQAAGLLSDVSQQFSPPGGQAQGEPGRGMSNGENSRIASQLGSSGTGAAGFEEADSPLPLQLRQQAMRDWGRLPAKLRSEILQSSERKTNGEYSEIIKLYFEQIAAEEVNRKQKAEQGG
ncbi:MAG: coiled-coil domain-containing protein [Planctomycetota bacterium]|jgi:hypothetical protein